jgi:hypothetical protein
VPAICPYPEPDNNNNNNNNSFIYSITPFQQCYRQLDTLRQKYREKKEK